MSHHLRHTNPAQGNDGVIRRACGSLERFDEDLDEGCNHGDGEDELFTRGYRCGGDFRELYTYYAERLEPPFACWILWVRSARDSFQPHR